MVHGKKHVSGNHGHWEHDNGSLPDLHGRRPQRPDLSVQTEIEAGSFRAVLIFSFLLLGCILLLLLNAMLGSVRLSAAEIAAAFSGMEADSPAGRILWDIRLPRLLAAAMLGGALSVSGFLLQTFFGNPIASPFVLGISSGAKLAVSLVMLLFLSRGIGVGSWGMIVAAFLGAMISMGVVLLISNQVRQMTSLVVCGVMIGYICSAVTDFAVTFADDADIVNMRSWSIGSFSGVSWENIRVMTPVILLSMASAFFMAKPMRAYQLGEGYARSLGVSLLRFRAALILCSSILSAVVAAFAGPVSFVGIAVPHLVKSMFRSSSPLLMIPGCFLGGAVFCLFCDLIARTAFAPAELGISSVTAVFGAPVAIFIMVRRKEGKSR